MRNFDGMQRCGEYRDVLKQQSCDDYQKHSKENRCRFLVFDDICDWHPQMACVENVIKRIEKSINESEFKWPSKSYYTEQENDDTINC